jgi:hypothetical protein
VHHNNVYYRPAAASIAEVPLTLSDIPGAVGIADWVYKKIMQKTQVMLFLGLSLPYCCVFDSFTILYQLLELFNIEYDVM